MFSFIFIYKLRKLLVNNTFIVFELKHKIVKYTATIKCYKGEQVQRLEDEVCKRLFIQCN